MLSLIAGVAESLLKDKFNDWLDYLELLHAGFDPDEAEMIIVQAKKAKVEKKKAWARDRFNKMRS